MQRKKKAWQITCLSIVLNTVMFSPCAAWADDAAALPPAQKKELQGLEQRLFAFQYGDDTVAHRLHRLEVLVYGEERTGTVADRLKNLETALDAPAPDATKPPATAETPPATTSSPTVATASGAAPAPAAQTPPAPSAPPPPPAVLHLSIASFDKAKGDPKRIIENVNSALRSEPQEPHLYGALYFRRAKAYWQLGNLGQTLTDLNSAISQDPNKADYYLARACLYKQQGNDVMAGLDLQQAHFTDPFLPAEITFDGGSEPSKD